MLIGNDDWNVLLAVKIQAVEEASASAYTSGSELALNTNSTVG
jgi:hypothetical protein